MSWESPSSLWLALTIPAIVLLWMLRPRRPRLRIPSLLLWPGSPAERQSARPWQRLRNHPLLWLQLAVAALLIGAAAQPFLPADTTSRHLVVFLDASGSMAAQEVKPDRFGVARDAVLEMASALGPDQEMTLIRVDDQPRLLIAGAHNAAQVEAALADQQPSYGAPDMESALSLATGLTTGPAEWVVVSDGGLPIPNGAQRPPGTGFRFVSVGQPAENIAITGLSSRQGDGQLTLQAGLRNLGAAPVEGSLQLLTEGQLASAQRWRLEPGAEGFVTWSHLPMGPGWYEARITGVDPAANALAGDDRAWTVIDAPSEPEVLLVTPGSSFLEQLLRAHGTIRPFRASPSDWPGLVAQGKSYPLTVLDRTPADPMPVGNLLIVGPTSGEEFRPTQVWPRPDHPLLRHVDWSEVQVASARKLPPLPGGETGGEGIGAWETVIDSDGGPLLAIREENGRRQAVLTFDLSQSDLPLRPSFPVLMANLLDWLLPRSGAAALVALPGGAVTVEPQPLAQQLWVEGPQGDRYDLAPPWPPLPFRPPYPGLYRVIQAWTSGQEESMLVASGYQHEEADLAPRDLNLPAADGSLIASARGAMAFWPWLAALLMLLSLIEWWVDARGR